MDRARRLDRAAALLLVISCGPGSPIAETSATPAALTDESGAISTSTGSTSTGSDAGGSLMLMSEGSGFTTETSAPTTETSATSTTAGVPLTPPQPCETWDDQCPDGQKCIPYSDEYGAGYPDKQGCFAVVDDPEQLGDTCTLPRIQDGNLITLDSCERGQTCSGLTGTCLALCQGGEWTCPLLSTCTGSEIELICWPICDPIEPACPAGETCSVLTVVGFQCYPADTAVLPLFAPCDDAYSCAAGTFCDAEAPAIECDPNSEGCCNKLCDLDGDTCPGLDQICVPFDFFAPRPEYADLGRCAVP